MSAVMVLLAIGLWLLCAVQEFWSCLGLILLWGLFLFFRFRGHAIWLLWVLLAGGWLIRLCMDQPVLSEAGPGVYTIMETHAGYALAKGEETTVVVYPQTHLWIGQQVYLEQFRPIHSLSNLGLFSFQKWINEKGIWQSGEISEILPVSSLPLKGQVCSFFFSHPAASLYQLLFYGMRQEGVMEWMNALGLPMLGLVQLLRKGIGRYLSSGKTRLCLLALILLHQCLFPFSLSIWRLFCFELTGLFFSKWSVRWSASVGLFLFLFPLQASALSFVLPALLSFAGHFQPSGTKRKITSLLVMSVLQMIYFQQINVLLLFGFSWLRAIAGMILLISTILIPFASIALQFQTMLFSIQATTDGWSMSGALPGWYALCLLFFLFQLLRSPRTKHVLCLVMWIGLYPSCWKLDPCFHVYMMDIGQGDCTIIVEPFMKSVVMIDAAGTFQKDNAQELIIPFLKTRGIETIDFLVVTHDDFDHSGSVESLVEHFPVGQVITDRHEKVNVDYPFESLLEERVVKEGEENDQSIVSYFSYDSFSYLWMGDASSLIESQIVEHYTVQADILKLGHHGSDTSSSKSFLQAVTPRLSLVSAGYGNRYDHPKAQVLKRVADVGSDVLGTHVQGMVSMSSLFGWMWIECADGTCSWLQANTEPKKDSYP